MRDTRIQKVLSEQGLCSRRAAEQIISEGRVTLNGRPVTLGDKMDTQADLLAVDGKSIIIPKKTEYYYYMLHKPRGYVTTMKDERGRKTVVDLLEGTPVRVYPVGRLDKDSEGLLLFTNDGDFANLLSHPSHGVPKTYRVTVHPRATEEQIVHLTDGVTLDDGTMTRPAVIRVAVDEPERTVMEMTIKEGKNRQIRRMCEAVGLEVARLRRISLGPVKLGMLPPGKYRELTPAEISALRSSAVKAANRLSSAKGQERAEQRSEGAAPRRSPSAHAAAPAAGDYHRRKPDTSAHAEKKTSQTGRVPKNNRGAGK